MFVLVSHCSTHKAYRASGILLASLLCPHSPVLHNLSVMPNANSEPLFKDMLYTPWIVVKRRKKNRILTAVWLFSKCAPLCSQSRAAGGLVTCLFRPEQVGSVKSATLASHSLKTKTTVWVKPQVYTPVLMQKFLPGRRSGVCYTFMWSIFFLMLCFVHYT